MLKILLAAWYTIILYVTITEIKRLNEGPEGLSEITAVLLCLGMTIIMVAPQLLFVALKRWKSRSD